MARVIAAWWLLACVACAFAVPASGHATHHPVTALLQAFAGPGGEGRSVLAGSATSGLAAEFEPFQGAGAGLEPMREVRPVRSLAADVQGGVLRAPIIPVADSPDVRGAGRAIALAYAVYAAMGTLLIASLALYSAARDRLFLLFAGYTTAALLFMATANGHLYALPGIRALGMSNGRSLWFTMLVFNAMALWMLLRFADTRASAHALVRRLDAPLPIVAGASALMLVPETVLLGSQATVAALVLAVAMAAGLLAVLDGARRGKSMAVATGCALLVVLVAVAAHGAMNWALLDEGALARHGYQFALVLMSVTVFVGLSSRIGAVRERLDLESSALVDSENRLRQARARSDLGQLLQERLRGLHPEEVAPRACRLLIQHVQATLPGTHGVVLAQGYLGHDLLLVQEDAAPASLGHTALAARAVIRAQVQNRQPVQLRLDGVRVSDDPGAPSHALVPMPVASPAWAALVLRDPSREFEPGDLEACMELARVTAMHADEAHASILLRRTAEHDALTGTMNRRSLDQVLAREFTHARLASLPLTVLFIDIDWFKRVNDEHGHACGDHCLRSIASTLRAELRPTDSMGRYGGEEFLVALPGHDAAASRLIAERLRLAVERSSIDWHGQSLALTISIGLAARRDSDATAAEMLERADKALYAAKREGRNRVCVAPAVFS